jgi:hypothetical protein
MTKLEELKATLEAAGTALDAAWADWVAARDASAYAARDASAYAAVDDYEAAWDARNAAWFDYRAELKKTKEQTKVVE